MNWVEVIKSAFAPYTDGEKPPLHTGEVFTLWYYLLGVEQSKRNSEVGFNTAQDMDLKNVLTDLIQSVHNPIIQELSEFLRDEGIPLPQPTHEKPVGEDYRNIPEGARLNDSEIANVIAWNESIGIQIAVRGLTESTRADVAAMFAKYQMMKVTWALTMKNLMQKRGWLHVPPYYKG